MAKAVMRRDSELPSICAQEIRSVAFGFDMAVGPTVAMVSIAVAVPPAVSASEYGEIVHRAPGGTEPHDNLTVRLNPFCEFNIIENAAVPPGSTVRLAGDPLSEKL
jgi:hypothetical protein